MLIAILFAVLVLSAGYATLRVLGLARESAALGLAAPAGLATLALAATWVGSVAGSPPGPGIVVLLCGLAGSALVVVDRTSLGRAIGDVVSHHRLPSLLLVAAVGVPIVSMGMAYAQVQAPLSPHDGAFHVETSDAFRRGAAVLSWYPPGLAALFGATLQLLPWLDSAAGAFQLGLGLTLLLPIAVFSLGVRTWHNLLAASVAAISVSFTHLMAYFPQAWSGWPQLIGMLLVIGLWTVGLEYVTRPTRALASLGAMLVGAIIVVHGTELYTSCIVLAVVSLANWGRLPWRRLGADLPLAIGLALVSASIYVPQLLHWAGTGGAYQVGLESGTGLTAGGLNAGAAGLLGAVALDALGVDLPVRLLLVALGIAFAFRTRTARALVTVTAVLVGLAAAFSLLNAVPPIRQVYAATYPWSVPYRQLSFAAVTLALLAGGGSVWLARGWAPALERIAGVVARRRLGRTGRLLGVTWVLLSTALVVVVLSGPDGTPGNFTRDDATVMTWLRAHAEPGAVVANDTFADAGIWVPYKAGLPILVVRSTSDPETSEARRLVIAEVARLDRSPTAMAAACALNVRYVYRGAQASVWQRRTFPPLEQLRASPALDEIFARGEAVLFGVRLHCPPG